MGKEQKALKSALKGAFAFCDECKAEIAGEAQKSLAREVLAQVKYIEFHLVKLKILMKEIIG